MANDLTVPETGAIADPTRLMKPHEISALNDSRFTSLAWDASHAAKQFEGANVSALVVRFDRALVPVASDWLQKRLRLLWKSSTPANSMDATAWLHETGRLLMDLPQDICANAINQCVKNSERGFMPTIGEIRKIADPIFAERQRHAERLKLVASVKASSGSGYEPERQLEREQCTPEEAAAIVRKYGIGDNLRQVRDPSRPTEQTGSSGVRGRTPTRADYINVFGMTPEQCDEAGVL